MNKDLMFSSKNQAWDTPQDFYDKLDREFHFDLDPCCTLDSCKCRYGFYCDAGQDGLKEAWYKNVYMNPPYSESKHWIQEAYLEVLYNSRCKLVVGLLPARTDTVAFHTYIWDLANNQPRPGVEVRFLKGRKAFGSDEYWRKIWDQEFIGTLVIDGKEQPKPNPLYKKYGKKTAAPFPSMVVIWRKHGPM